MRAESSCHCAFLCFSLFLIFKRHGFEFSWRRVLSLWLAALHDGMCVCLFIYLASVGRHWRRVPGPVVIGCYGDSAPVPSRQMAVNRPTAMCADLSALHDHFWSLKWNCWRFTFHNVLTVFEVSYGSVKHCFVVWFDLYNLHVQCCDLRALALWETNGDCLLIHKILHCLYHHKTHSTSIDAKIKPNEIQFLNFVICSPPQVKLNIIWRIFF